MPDQELKLFLVEGEESNSLVSRMMNYGDDYGETYSFTKIVVSDSSSKAIEQVWNDMEEKCNQHQAKIQKVRDEVKALEDEGKEEEAAARLYRARTAGLFGEVSPFPPFVPEKREKWRAKEVTVEGYRIRIEPA